MSNDILKQALLKAQIIEMEKIPDEDELSKIQVFSPQFEAKMQKLINRTKNKYFDILGFNIKRSVAIFIVVILAMSTALSVEAVRKPIINLFLEIYEKFSRIRFNSEDAIVPPATIENFYEPTNIPSGYRLVEENNFGDSYELIYSNDVYEVIFEQSTLKNKSITVDTEDVPLEPILINGHQGFTCFSKNTRLILWDNGYYSFDLTGVEDLETLENMANSIQIKNK